MKFIARIVIAAVCAAALVSTAHAAGHVGQCVFPKTKTGRGGRLVLPHPVDIFEAPNAAAAKHQLTTPATFTITADAPGGFVQLVTVPDYDLPNPQSAAGKVVGWAKLTDFRFQDLRNCN
ncbi:hypothetical protein [Ralstonia pickettii]|uniref:hypothetical protein n=1 Tax=Ralstonia pickettii TaxID=329 RepID=UPI0015B80120|nr:hypothetical protein [Ralstonia pickettii]NWK43330.1 hypothetical protein [Ralstonia pickettii]